MKKVFMIMTIALLILTFLFGYLYARRGCCSWHGGVAGCDKYGRVICADGTVSKTCRCGE